MEIYVVYLTGSYINLLNGNNLNRMQKLMHLFVFLLFKVKHLLLSIWINKNDNNISFKYLYTLQFN